MVAIYEKRGKRLICQPVKPPIGFFLPMVTQITAEDNIVSGFNIYTNFFKFAVFNRLGSP